MHGGLPDKRNSELPTGEKRTLRAAIDGSPARPDAKSVRGNQDNDHCAPPEACADTQAADAVFTRYLAHLIISMYHERKFKHEKA